MSSPPKSVFVAAVSLIVDKDGNRQIHNSPAWPLIDYFRRRAERLDALELTVPRPNLNLPPQLVSFRQGKYLGRRLPPRWLLAPFHNRRPNPYKTSFRLKARDALTLLWALGRTGPSHELFIGLESLMALMGGMRKKAGRFDKSVYYVSDWSPRWFANPLLNKVYLALDRNACRHSDFIWNYTAGIADARRDLLRYDMSRMGTQLWVPFGFFRHGITFPPDEAIDLDRLVYSGSIVAANGVDLIVEALPLILSKAPRMTIDVFGDGPDLPGLKARPAELGVAHAVAWHGYVSERQRILDAMLTAAVSLAPFAPIENSVKQYGDVIKIREAIGTGTPVVTTSVPPSHAEVRNHGLGMVIDYTPTDLARAVLDLLKNPKAYARTRQRVIQYSEKFLWPSIYDRALADMGYGTLERFEPQGLLDGCLRD